MVGSEIITEMDHEETVSVLNNNAKTQIRKHCIYLIIFGEAIVFENEPFSHQTRIDKSQDPMHIESECSLWELQYGSDIASISMR